MIIGAAESPYARHPPEGLTTEALLADVYLRVLADAGVDRTAVDGLGVASFTLAPDHVADLAWRLGIRARWLMEDTNGGAAAINLLQHAIRAVDAGDANMIVLLTGDVFGAGSFRRLLLTYNRVMLEQLARLPSPGPNPLFAMLTQLHMDRHGLGRSDYAKLVIAQREWAAGNPGAVYRTPLSVHDYMAAPIVSEPLVRFDCVPVVSGADALLVSRASEGVRVRAVQAFHNFDGQDGDGLVTGLSEVRETLWSEASLEPGEIDVVSVYDDYPVMVLVQLADLGFVPADDFRALLERIASRQLALNTSGGQLSAGQAGAAGGMHGLVEVVTQLRRRARGRQVDVARRALATGYGMTLYRYGACSNVVVLERA